MILTDEMTQFIHGGVSINIGTRDASLKPHVTWGWGAIADKDKGTITTYIHERESQNLVTDIENNKAIAVAIGSLGTHDAYQFKGEASVGKSGENDYAVQEIYRKKYIDALIESGIPEDVLKPLHFRCSIAVNVKVTEIYLTTPGPDAGKLISSQNHSDDETRK